MLSIHYSGYVNFGDAVNPYLIERLIGGSVRRGNRRFSRVCCVGSILTKFVRPGRCSPLAVLGHTCCPILHVWTSGFLQPAPPRCHFWRRMQFHALRGRLSLQEVTRILGTEPNIPLGDGGLLVNALLEASPPKRYALGIIPHLIESHEPVFADLARQVPRATLIDLSRDPLYVLDQIAACETILSSAMHGLIAADALGIPNRWVRVSEAVLGGTFKFQDYYSVYALEGIKPWAVADVCAFGKRLPEVIANEYAVPRMRVAEIQQTLLKVFPNL